MITDDQFSKMFDKLRAQFGAKKSAETKDAWGDELQGCDYFTLCRTFKLLRLGDKFPNLGMVWDTYRPMLPPELQAKERDGCDNCQHGRVFYVDYILSRRDDPDSPRVLNYSLVANCASCSKDVTKGYVNLRREHLALQPEGEYWTARALKALPEEIKKNEKEQEIRKEKWKKEHRFSGMRK